MVWLVKPVPVFSTVTFALDNGRSRGIPHHAGDGSGFDDLGREYGGCNDG